MVDNSPILTTEPVVKDTSKLAWLYNNSIEIIYDVFKGNVSIHEQVETIALDTKIHKGMHELLDLEKIILKQHYQSSRDSKVS